MPGIADFIGKIRRVMNAGAAETFDQATDSLEAISDALAPVALANGLFYAGTVTAAPGANQFTIPALAGLGANALIGPLGSPYYAFVQRDAGGAAAAPQGEMMSITAYDTATGVFTTQPFTAAVGIGDRIIIMNPRLAEIGIVQGLQYYGVVTAVPGANQFTVPLLAGQGANKFIGLWPYWVYVLRDAAGGGALPQGELQTITAYATATGTFTTAAFSAAVGVGDEIIVMNPMIANLITIMGAILVPTADVATNAYMRDPVGNKADAAVYVVSAVNSLVAYVKGLLNRANNTYNQVNAIPVLTETGGSITTTGAAQDIWHIAAPLGVFKPLTLKLDCSAMAAADVMHITVYERIVAGGGMVISDYVEFSGVQAIPLKTIHLDPNRFGVEVTIHETAGAHVAYPWAIVEEV
jgi:hypothetical protein